MTETQIRFLRAIAERVSLDRVAELHLFPAMRQGGMESGVAVVAIDREAENTDLPPTPAHSVTVFTASYRLALKGAERGKWETDIVEEADAPLVTVDEVVRGVQRRSGEGQDPERLTRDQLLETIA